MCLMHRFIFPTLIHMAETVGFEPTRDCSQTDFESAPL